MFICVTPEDAARLDEVETNVEGGSIFPIMGGAREAGSPFAFNAHQTVVCVLPPHFHPVDQFQVFTCGSGKVGGHRVAAGTIHYSDANTAYGPLVPADEGFSYLTLRPRYEEGYHVLPASLELLKERTRERKGSQKVVKTDPSQVRPSGADALWSREDGVSVFRIDAAPGDRLAEVPTTSPRYYVVMRGSVLLEGRCCPNGTCLWASAGSSLPELQAGEEGAMLAVVCFARPA